MNPNVRSMIEAKAPSSLDLALALKLATALAPGPTRYGVKAKRGRKLRLPRHPDSPDPADLQSARRWVRNVNGPTAIDLFCGAGGLGLGFHNAGISVLVGADSQSSALETYAANLPCLTYEGDLSDPSELLGHLRAWGISSVDLVAGGVPCQPFSRAGRSKIRSLVEARVRHAEDARADLWQSFIHVVKALRPQAVLLENVPDLAEWDDGAVMVGFCEALQSQGYEADARILHAYEHGVPQHRSRLFIVGVRQGHRFRWPEREEPQPTLWDAIGDLPELPGGNRNDRLPYGGPTSELQRRLRKGVSRPDRDWIYDHITREVRADDLEAFRALPEGGTYEDVPAHLRRYRSDIFTDKYKRLSRSELSRTITAHIARDGYWYIHPLQHRTLSIREAARIQTFPDWFRFAGEPSHRFRQVGNAVPVLMAEAVGRALMESITSHSQSKRRSLPTFRSELVEWHQGNARLYPWRNRALPWHVLMAELCLHRSPVDQATSVYSGLIKIAPSPAALIANEAEARGTMESHGLHWREGHVLKVARMLVDEFGGKVPASREELLTLPGVGDYVANAVLCFAFGKPSVLMDTNTERIVSRLDGNSPRSRRWQLRLDLYRLAGPTGANAEFNWALLDLGATICTMTSPRCLACPVAKHCQTFGDLDN